MVLKRLAKKSSPHRRGLPAIAEDTETHFPSLLTTFWGGAMKVSNWDIIPSWLEDPSAYAQPARTPCARDFSFIFSHTRPSPLRLPQFFGGDGGGIGDGLCWKKKKMEQKILLVCVRVRRTWT